jgi:AraC-like DNA-binding protein
MAASMPKRPHRQTLSRDDCLFREAIEIIETRLGDAECEASSVAEQLCISVRTLNRLFQERGTTFGQWIRSQRLERAHDDLTGVDANGLTVAEIGARWGMTDPAHFSRIFRATWGISPTECRNSGCSHPPLEGGAQMLDTS